MKMNVGRLVIGSGAAAAIAFMLSHPLTLTADDGARYARDGAQSCLTCHDRSSDHPADDILFTAHALTGDLRTPFGAGRNQCETCHGPSEAHLSRMADGTRPPPSIVFSDAMPVARRNAVCMDCHQGGDRLHWESSAHNFEQLSCTSCHSLHTPRDPVMAAETQPQVCFECHQKQRAELMRPSRHPVQGTGLASHAGSLSCTDCHSPHGSSTPSSLVRSTLNETCYDCHAEKRGPFLWEHGPVREDCSTCHTPHGSNHANLLVARAPWMCQQCHIAQRHPSTAFSGTGVQPTGAAQQILARNCMNCHTQVHGSNHPSGVRKTR